MKRLLLISVFGAASLHGQNIFMPMLAGGAGTCTAYANFKARLATLPTTDRAQAYKALICNLANSGVLAKLDALYVFAAADSATALTNLVQSSYAATAVSSPTFTADRGFTFNGSSSYLDTNFNPTTASSPKFTQNSASFSVWQLSPAVDTHAVFSSSTNLRNDIFTRFTGDLWFYRINSASTVPSGGGASNNGARFFSASRTASTGSSLYINGVSQGTDTVTSAAPDNSNFFIGKDRATFNASQVATAHFGAGLTAADELVLYREENRYLRAVNAYYWSEVTKLVITASATGTVNTSSSTVTSATGTTFTTGSSWVGRYILINGTNYTISSVTDSTHLVTSEFIGTLTGASYSFPGTSFRIDSIEALGATGVLLAGTRGSAPGQICRSTDNGRTWATCVVLHTGDITTIKYAAATSTVYVLAGDSHLWSSTDGGLTWSPKNGGNPISTNTRTSPFQLTYGLLITATGRILVGDTSTTGNVFYSDNGGGTFTDAGAQFAGGLYRFENIGSNCIIAVGGFSGTAYPHKSCDDGLTFTAKGGGVAFPLYAVEYPGSNIVLAADDSGCMWRSLDNGDTWPSPCNQITTDGADDMANDGVGGVLFTTYNGSRRNYISKDFGASWLLIGTTDSLTTSGDTIEHAVYVRTTGQFPQIVMVTTKGSALLAIYP